MSKEELEVEEPDLGQKEREFCTDCALFPCQCSLLRLELKINLLTNKPFIGTDSKEGVAREEESEEDEQEACQEAVQDEEHEQEQQGSAQETCKNRLVQISPSITCQEIPEPEQEAAKDQDQDQEEGHGEENQQEQEENQEAHLSRSEHEQEFNDSKDQEPNKKERTKIEIEQEAYKYRSVNNPLRTISQETCEPDKEAVQDQEEGREEGNQQEDHEEDLNRSEYKRESEYHKDHDHEKQRPENISKLNHKSNQETIDLEAQEAVHDQEEGCVIARKQSDQEAVHNRSD